MSRPLTLQEFPLASGIQAIQDSLLFTDFSTFYRNLHERLPQNSPETRSRYAQRIVRWFFPERKLDSLLPRVWQAYGDHDLLLQLIRAAVLETEPVIARFIVEVVQPLPQGDFLDLLTVRDYITTVYGAFKDNSYRRLLSTTRDLGYIERVGRQWAVAAIRPPSDAFLLLFHARLAPTPRIVRLSELLADSFWRHLGFRQPDEVRAVLHSADTEGLVARYTVVDQLEQVTTRYTLDEYLDRALRLRPQ